MTMSTCARTLAGAAAAAAAAATHIGRFLMSSRLILRMKLSKSK
jgi:hypothetical protein